VGGVLLGFVAEEFDFLFVE
jgi:hypothetical protein